MYKNIFSVFQLSGLLLLMATSVIRVEAAETNSGEDCDSSMRHTLITCPFEELGRQEVKLAEVITRLKATLQNNYPDTRVGENSYADAIDAAQAAWLQYRDNECEWRGYTSGNQEMFSRSMTIDCMAEMTRSRIRELQALIEA